MSTLRCEDTERAALAIPPLCGRNEAYRPSALYNAMVAPFTGYGIIGVIWY